MKRIYCMNSAFFAWQSLLLSSQLSNQEFLERTNKRRVLKNSLCLKMHYHVTKLANILGFSLCLLEANLYRRDYLIHQIKIMWHNTSRKPQARVSISTWTNWPKHVTVTRNIATSLRAVTNSPFSHCWLLKIPPSSRARPVFMKWRVLTSLWPSRGLLLSALVTHLTMWPTSECSCLPCDSRDATDSLTTLIMRSGRRIERDCLTSVGRRMRWEARERNRPQWDKKYR